MEEIPIGTAIIIFACALFVGFFWGSRSGPKSRSSLTPRAQQVLALAREEASRLNHSFVGTEHLLLGLTKLDQRVQSVAVNVLKNVGLDLDMVRTEVEKLIGRGFGEKLIGDAPYTPRTKKVLSFAVQEAKGLNHTQVDTEHILLGILREGGGVAASVLKNMNVNLEQTRQEILNELDPNFGKNPRA
jgi:ATP-dependent Clp protease ATP-binding subunit ClpC